MEQEDDKQYSREAVFAGRRVSVVGSDARSRGRVPGYASSSLYRESGIISARQLALLQRMLPRLRLEQDRRGMGEVGGGAGGGGGGGGGGGAKGEGGGEGS
ncbi:T3SS regulon anti-activator ExsD domain-containing protein, partial [Pseudomonas aeruginosa]|uniref:T3SS regulon anti-activator ExsD domain-containing protein n=1 Tax=Pseudomonas aeruginosa TaxID=287 RepID=UPI0039822279